MITLEDVQRAKQTVETFNRQTSAHIRHTQLIPSDSLSRMTSTELFFKPECLQVTGSFKVPGIINTLVTEMNEDYKGILGVSSGNQGLCIAYIAKLLGKKSLIMVPQGASTAKMDLIRSFGGEVVQMNFDSFDSALQTCTDLANEKGYYYPNLFSNENFIAGHGTLGLQILEDIPEADAVVVPGGSGVLAAGLATACKAIKPSIKIYAVGAQNSSCLLNAFQQQRPYMLSEIPETICDGLRSPIVTELVIDHVLKYVDDIVTVTDEEVINAMRLIWTQTKLLTEPSGAVTLAALLANRLPIKDEPKVVCLLTGGNTDMKTSMEYMVN